jgi:hypothetical protein
MKKLLAIGICLVFLGCSESRVDENGRHIAEKSGDSFVVNMFPGGGSWTFYYIEVDGHEYLLMTGVHISGLTHSPKCPCLSNHNIVTTTKAN